jgi:BlaI family penicillinase repressor
MKTPRITETEWEVMRVIWAHSPLAAQDIIDTLSARDHWHPKTVRTLLGRLVKRRALGFQREGRAYLYRPLVAEKDCIAAASESFLDRIFGGSLKPMLAHFVESRRLTADEIAELKRLLKNKEDK